MELSQKPQNSQDVICEKDTTRLTYLGKNFLRKEDVRWGLLVENCEFGE